ncbi:MAG: hypothetical protein RJA99_3163 [Pseudomonadota bacterium]
MIESDRRALSAIESRIEIVAAGYGQENWDDDNERVAREILLFVRWVAKAREDGHLAKLLICLLSQRLYSYIEPDDQDKARLRLCVRSIPDQLVAVAYADINGIDESIVDLVDGERLAEIVAACRVQINRRAIGSVFSSLG